MFYKRKIFNTWFSPIIALFCLSIIISSCASKKDMVGNYKVGGPYQIDGKWYYPKEQQDYNEEGIASWYGDDFHDKKTANGGVYDKNSLTAAHKTLPLPSMVRVTNMENNKTLILMVNDRGPFSNNRIIDVSEQAAKILGFKDKGVAKVRVQYLPGQTKRLIADLPGAKDKSGLFSAAKTDDRFNSFEEETGPIEKSLDVAAETLQDGAKKILQTKAIKDINPKKASKAKTKTTTVALANDEGDDIKKFKDAEEENPNMLATKDRPEIKQKPASISTPENKEQVNAEEITKEVFFVQAGTYGVEGNAKRVEKKLAPIGTVNVIPVKINGKMLYKVKVGPILEKPIADLALKKVITLGHPDAIILKEGGEISIE